ncbi:(2Fe-2S)-binding protein [Paraburkholderia sp. J76]|uniref:(2Fe-2S)-binding protein n=1 Tax=Paraburkholderia sp. J76 TaxID=2805439 RepID=UPI002ABE9151|nr:(2Fe-2S)-binding protein [Paraburkholderia sp. J76]
MHTVTRTGAPRPTASQARQAEKSRQPPHIHPHTPPETIPFELTINGTPHTLHIEPWTSLLDLLREHLHLTGTKKGCDHGQCGACTVLINGTRINACLALAVSHDGAEITTIEGLAQGDALHPVQQAFIDHDAFQCGYCTSGQICSAVGLLAEGHAQCRDDVREQMSGNLCRCGAYVNIANAVDGVRRAQNVAASEQPHEGEEP